MSSGKPPTHEASVEVPIGVREKVHALLEKAYEFQRQNKRAEYRAAMKNANALVRQELPKGIAVNYTRKRVAKLSGGRKRRKTYRKRQ